MKAIIKSKNLEVFIREDLKTETLHFWNEGKIKVSKQKTGNCCFYIDESDLEIINEVN